PAPAAVPAGPAPAPQKVEKIEVTGSNIKRVDAETIAPVQIITREEIERSGKQTITEVLRTLPINSTGGLNDIQGANSFSSGASTVSLRGLGSAATLVLLNGRRVAPFGGADPNFGQSAVVNLDAFPLDVVERVEILKDGASAIYGSEAVAGVVNIILRKDFKGAIAGGSFSINNESEYQVRRATATVGYGDLAKDRFNVFLNVERFERDVAKVDDVQDYLVRPELRDNNAFATFRRFASSYAGNYLTGAFNLQTGLATALAFRAAAQQPANCNPGAIRINGICRWDVPARQDIVPESTRDNVFVRGAIDFTPTLSGFAELGYNRIQTTFRGNPQVYGDFGSWYSGSLQRLVNMPEFLPATHPNNPFGAPVILRHRFVEVGNTDRLVDANAVRLSTGLKGVWGALDWEAGFLHNKNETEVVNLNQIRLTPLTQGVLNGTYNFLNPGAGSIKPDDLRINTRDVADSSFQILDFKLSGEVAQMPAGPVGIAAGLEFRKEDREARPDPNKVTGEVVGFGASIADGKRDVKSAFVEVNLPVFATLEAQLAMRMDRYSDYGSSNTPKLGIKWKALPNVALRSSYAKGFRAPSLTEISRSSVTAFAAVTDPKRCIIGNEPACNAAVAFLLENANRLEPETSTSRHAGIVWDITRDASLSFDAFDIRRKQEITTLDADTILANEGATTGIYANRVIRGPVLPGEQFGPLQAISTFFFNSGKTEIKGYDLDALWRFSIGDYGKLTTRAAATYFKSVKGNGADDEPVRDFAGFGVPRTRATATVVWNKGAWNVSATANFSGGYNVLREPLLTCSAAIRASQPDCFVDPSTTTDMAVAWTGIRGLTLTLVARNITNKKPVLDSNARPANFTFHPFQGTYYTVGANYRFR
ncbi:MAG: TonB-dependent receptor, partial [Betaproteobacteria bacterium]|nr:TonB-dependent receptor [Betaproteobacteria bacterium]